MTKLNTSNQPKTNSSIPNSLGVRTTNRHPSKISLDNNFQVEALASNIDTLELSLDVQWTKHSYMLILLAEAKPLAISRKQPCPVQFTINDNNDYYSFNVQEYGANGYEWILSNQEYTLKIGNWLQPQSMPSVTISIRSETLWRKNPVEAIRFILKLITEAGGGKICKTRVSRLDICVDALFPDELWSENILNYAVTRATTDSEYSSLINTHRNHKNLATIQIGKGKLQVRLYDKALEIKAKGNKKIWMYDIWGKEEVPEGYKIIRIEFQLRREVLKELGIDSIEDLFELTHHAWAYCTTQWLKFQDNPGKQSHQRKTLPWWETIQHGFSSMPLGYPLIRCKAVNGERIKNSQQVIGNLLSFVALGLEEGKFDYRNINIKTAWKSFEEYLEEIDYDDIDFAEKVEIKRAKYQRLDNKYRERFEQRKEYGFLKDNSAKKCNNYPKSFIQKECIYNVTPA